jgi:hypothetical protein
VADRAFAEQLGDYERDDAGDQPYQQAANEQ